MTMMPSTVVLRMASSRSARAVATAAASRDPPGQTQAAGQPGEGDRGGGERAASDKDSATAAGLGTTLGTCTAQGRFWLTNENDRVGDRPWLISHPSAQPA